jgi:hypothetical protein
MGEMMTDKTTTTETAPWDTDEGQAKLLDVAGPVAVREFNSAPDYGKREVWEKLMELPTLDRATYLDRVEGYVHEAAFWSSRRGNHEHVHALTSAAYHVDHGRMVREGSDERCPRHSWYQDAHDRAVRSCGYTPMPRGACTCSTTEGEA